MMDGSIRPNIEKYGYDYFWKDVSEYFKADDLTIGNLETSITMKAGKWPNKQFNFRSDPANVWAMERAGIDVLSLANNHILDYGYAGLIDTMNLLDQSLVKYVGAGRNKSEAIKGEIIEKNGLKIGILSFSRVVPDVKWYGTNKRAGLVGAYDGHIPEVERRIKEMKEETDLVVLSIHWGVERSQYPRGSEQKLARRLIDSGADIIMGHHPHVIQGIEVYKGKPIFYSLGNFVFTGKKQPMIDTMIGQINLIGKNIDSIEVIPFQIKNGRPIKIDDNYNKSSINTINKLSKSFNVKFNENGLYKIKQ